MAKIFRSVSEFRRYYFPKTVAEEERKERELEILRNPEKYGTGLMQELLENLRKALQKNRK